jgi:hypothetical protein
MKKQKNAKKLSIKVRDLKPLKNAKGGRGGARGGYGNKRIQ